MTDEEPSEGNAPPDNTLKERLVDLLIDHTPTETARGYRCDCYRQGDQPWSEHLADELMTVVRDAYSRGVDWAQEHCPTGGWETGL